MKNQFKKPFKAFYSIFTINYFRITKKSLKNYLCYFKDNVFYHLFLEIMIFFGNIGIILFIVYMNGLPNTPKL